MIIQAAVTVVLYSCVAKYDHLMYREPALVINHVTEELCAAASTVKLELTHQMLGYKVAALKWSA